MLDTYRRIFQILGVYERGRALVLLCLFLGLGVAETLGAAAIMPFMSVIANPQIIETNPLLSTIYERFGFSAYNQFLVALGIAVAAVLVGTLMFGALTHWFLHRFTQMCSYRLSARLLGAYFSRPYVWFVSHHSVDLGRTVLDEVQSVVMRAVLPSMHLLSRLVVAVCLLGLIVAVDPAIALSAAACLGGSYGLIYLGARRYLARLGNETWRANQQRFKIAHEGLGAIKDVKVSGLEKAYLERFRVAARRHARNQANHQIIGILPRFILEGVTFGGMIAVVIALLILRDEGFAGALPVIAVYAFAGYKLLPALQQIYQDLVTMRVGARALERIHAELAEASPGSSARTFEVRQDEPPLALTSRLELVDVSYSYPGARSKALDGINMSIRANTTVGFVGATGAGKTTVVDIILGLLEPDHGRLLVDGVAVSAENLRRWQRALGYVPQHIFLADDTVAANIAFGEPPERIDTQAVEKAARMAELHEFVTQSLPQGYATAIGERGVRLSGGQRQRIGIARALYHDPGVLVLDEATSALDNVTERAVMSAVTSLGREKTIIMIAHRLSTVDACDQIFVLERGRLVASGAYAKLEQENPQFRAMARARMIE
jgi:ABC-type multidrug transport system fused ATPase/permease subunit